MELVFPKIFDREQNYHLKPRQLQLGRPTRRSAPLHHLRALAPSIQLVYISFVTITKVFRSENSQAVRIPKGFRFRSGQVEILKRGKDIVLRERQANLSAAFELLTGLSPDFFKGGRRQPKLDKRLGF